MKMIALICLSIIIGCYAQMTPCFVPEQFISNMQQVYRDGNGCNFLSIQGVIYYDYPNQQLRIDQSAMVYSYTYTETVWIDYNSGTSWVYYRDTDECYTGSVSGGLSEPQIPSGSTYGGEFLLGNQVLDVWVAPTQDDYITTVSLTRGSCFVFNVVTTNSTSDFAELDQTFFSFLPDLPPFYFDLPAACSSAKSSAKRGNTQHSLQNALKIKVPSFK